MALPRPRPGADLSVARARVSGVRATRGDVAHWLGGVPLETLGLGPDEVFYVPRLAVRLPGYGPGGATRVPERIAAELRALLAGAQSGSSLGFVPGRPYRFTGRARYFAWLAALWLRGGTAAARDAFRSATGEQSLAAWQRHAVLRDGSALVSMIARLAEAGAAAQWVARLEPADLEQAFQAIEAWFGVRIALPAREGRAQTAIALPDMPATRAAPRPARIAARLAAAGNDWQALAPPARALLVTAVLIADAPARSAPGHAAILAEITALAMPMPQPAAPPPASPPQPRPAQARAPAREEPAPIASAEPRQGPRPAPPPPVAATERRSTPPAPAAMVPDATAPILAARKPDRAPPGMPASEAPASTAIPSSSGGATRPAPPPPYLAAPDRRFATGYGGLLFLLNAFVALGLYPDFTRPLGDRLGPSPLWLADRIGRHWFGRPYRRDPLAAWIAANAAPGRLPRTWRPEPDWLDGFSTAGARFAQDRGRATLWCTAGFPLEDGPARRVSRPPRARAAGRVPRLPRAPDDRWAACLALYLDARLRAVAGSGLSALALPAEIRTLDLDLRATFRLDCHPIALRIAGLDRDPGWQPAEGRAFAFVFA